jgi:hypothetical protein
LIAIAVFLRETGGDMTLHKRAKALRNAAETRATKQKWTSKPRNIEEMLQHSSIKAAHMLITESIVFALRLWIVFT